MQNHRTTECLVFEEASSSDSTTLLCQDLVEQLVNEHFWLCFEYLYRCLWLHNVSGNPVPLYDHPQWKQYFVVSQNLIFKIVLIASCLVSGLCWEEFGFLFFIASHQVLIHIDGISLSLLSFRLNSPISPSIFSHEKCYCPLSSSWPCAGLAPVSPYLSCTGEARIYGRDQWSHSSRMWTGDHFTEKKIFKKGVSWSSTNEYIYWLFIMPAVRWIRRKAEISSYPYF